MKLVEALEKYSNQEIISRIEELYDIDEANAMSYNNALRELRTITPVEEDFSIGLTVCQSSNGKEYIDVSGYPPGSDEAHAMEFSPWEEWLDMEIQEKTLEEFGLLDTVAHCLWEMTFVGYSNEEITGERDMLGERLREVDEHPERCIPAEEVLNKIENRFAKDAEE